MLKKLQPFLVFSSFIIILVVLYSLAHHFIKTTDTGEAYIIDSSDAIYSYGYADESIEKRIDDSSIKSIKIETTSCFGPCPVFTAEFYNDGMAHYKGGMYTDLKGEYIGEYYKSNFIEMCEYIEFAEIEKLKSKYELMATDMSSTTIVIGYKDGSTKSIHDYGHIAPIQFRFFETYLKNLIDDIKWEKVDE